MLVAGCLAAGGVAIPSTAQQSTGYQFLQAVRDAKSDEVTKTLNTPGTRIVDTRDVGTGEAALHIVAKRGDVSYTRFFLDRGADPNIRDSHGNTPMMIAATAGQEGVLKALIDGHANANLANSSGETPLIIAVQHRDLQMVRDLLAAGGNPDQRDVVAGLSARDYARRDARVAAIAKLIEATPMKKPAAVSGPKL